jgi:homoserine O-acetyltransferase
MSLPLINKQVFEFTAFTLDSGKTLPYLRLGYETYGRLNAACDNAILIAHHFSGTSHAAGRYSEDDAEPGYWDAIIGPGKAIDTDTHFVIAVDSLCNLMAKDPLVTTTGPSSVEPETGKPYGTRFPVVTIGDFVEAQRLLCDRLGIQRLQAVAGPSMGSMQALEWAVRYPKRVARVIAAISPGFSIDAYLLACLTTWCAPIVLDANYNGGDYYSGPEPLNGLTQAIHMLGLDSLHPDGVRKVFARRWAHRELDPHVSLDHRYAIDRTLDTMSYERAKFADANSFRYIARAVQLFNIEDRLDELSAPVLFIPARSDLIMPPALSEKAADHLRSRGVSADLFVIEGEGGHLDGLLNIGRASSVIRDFLTT